MKLNQVLKGLLIAVPALALTACSSTSDTDAQSSSSSNQQQVESGVQTGAIEQVQTPEEIQRQKYEQLRQEHIIYFDFDRSDVSGQYAELLEAHAAFLVENPSTKVLIEGHADERGTPEYNIALGERRAKAVERYLQGLGVLSSQITIVSYGEEKPLDSSATDAAHAKNRRAVLVY
ncbi:peptidoglycan-associated lipoprotein [Ferrimonas balearica DSM 9799]|uniref:Peptidoglycan-associated lipoprotein n=1 Tax=Ferrimonas balearica (strain DSM 9799 / CCM 4581 / KCTC 23876 / PAT) TaxID=550540 RepID=E1SLC5_FERBD|nr:peptidoglycan-associated lipoprotein Pal [Ferrimonas balearica]MBY6016964.1 peptidoglycan-associated lipoprotein Pal [Halomonas denitrificans]ADN76489.1 peptidoglycan-associated lipoprotein [Ferrimonas balearica DSM 9799]MBW3139389.1 peptidoglycan-associated lipoprotein Pal [Ferrimonas balearica]MBW3163022.1 peptidoglycan-associated lipoprotein Pal [Ferrimonas balearica]MBY5980714.1 peptidoglycan-associated lipoprotein Pal [Ferrimonas balearica]